MRRRMKRWIDGVFARLGYVPLAAHEKEMRDKEEDAARLRQHNEELRRRLLHMETARRAQTTFNHQRIDKSVRTLDGICEELRAMVVLPG